MLPLFAKPPAPPPRALAKASTKDVATEATGIQIASNDGLKIPENRFPGHMHDTSPKPSEQPEDDIFTYFQKEADKKDGASCVFLLWGSEDSERSPTCVVDVPIADPENEDEIFASLAKQYAKQIGFLRRWFCFRKFSRLKPVTFRIINRSSTRFLAFAKSLDLVSPGKMYSEQREKAMTTIDIMTNLDYGDDPWDCYRDSSGGWQHRNGSCPVYDPTNSETACPFMIWETCNDQLQWIETAPFLSSYFLNPAGARSQHILNGFEGHYFIHQYSKIFLPSQPPRPLQPRPQSRHVELHGLYVETMWDLVRCFFVFIGILLCVVAGGKLFWGTWEVVFGAGSFFVALPMLALTLLSYH